MLSCRCGRRRDARPIGRPLTGISGETIWKATAGALALVLALSLTWTFWPGGEAVPAEDEDKEIAAEPIPETSQQSTAAPLPLEDLLENVLPDVVSIVTSSGTGSGFFVDEQTIITNYHVVGSDTAVEIKLRNGSVVGGRVERVSQDYDLALIRTNLPITGHAGLSFTRVEGIKVGQEVMVIGSPLGVLESSVTRGIVSAVRTYDTGTLVQTDAAINPGNSGGPVINREGRVIGIATMKAAQGESLGFAVASNHALELIAGGGSSPSSLRASRVSENPMLRRNAPTKIEDLTEDELEVALDEVMKQYQAPFDQLRGAVARCPDLSRKLEDTSAERLDFELGKIVLEYVDQRRVYSRDGRYIPEWSEMSCLRGAEQILQGCYEAILVYDEVYKVYVRKRAVRSRAPRVNRHLPAI
jgi:hypothetical protein